MAKTINYILGHSYDFIEKDWSNKYETTLLISPYHEEQSKLFSNYSEIVANVIITDDPISSNTYVCDYSTALAILSTNIATYFTNIVIFYKREHLIDIHIIYTWLKETNEKAREELLRYKKLTIMVPRMYLSKLFEGDYNPKEYQSTICNKRFNVMQNTIRFIELRNDQTIDEILETIIVPHFKDKMKVIVIVPTMFRIRQELIDIWSNRSVSIQQIHPLKYGITLQSELDDNLDQNDLEMDLVIDLSYETKEDVESRMKILDHKHPTDGKEFNYVVGCSRKWYCDNVPVSPMNFPRWNQSCIGSSLATYNGYELKSEEYNGRTELSDDRLFKTIDLVRQGIDPEASIMLNSLNDSNLLTNTRLFQFALVETVRRLRPEVVYDLDGDNTRILLELLNDNSKKNLKQYDDIVSLFILIDYVRDVILEAAHHYYQRLCDIFNFIPLKLDDIISEQYDDLVLRPYIEYDECLNFQEVNISSNNINMIIDENFKLLDISNSKGKWWCIFSQ